MSLKLKTKSVRFEFVDDDVESVVTLSSDDDEAILVRKMRRLIELVEVHQGQEGNAALMPLAERMTAPAVTFVPPAPTNGWAAAYGPPALPDRLKGEVELIPPGEDA